MAVKVNRPRPATKFGLASDVRSGAYKTRSPKLAKPRAAKARTGKPGVRR
jgi:hypothetical protein